MPTWSEILTELDAGTVEGKPRPFDAVRRKYLVALHEHTKRNVILYAAKFTEGDSPLPDLTIINDQDIQGLMEVIHGLTGPDLDLIIHSPGGRPEAAGALVTYLRSKFSHIRVVVPTLAMSAATMMACAADRIVLGKHSFLGPTDPQFVLHTKLGPRFVPAQAILDQFNKALDQCQDPKHLGAWAPILPQYGPDLLVTADNWCQLSREMVSGWLSKYMFRDDADRDAKAKHVADWLASHGTHKLHGRHLSRDEVEAQGLKIDRLEDDQRLQDLVLSVFHATTHTFGGTLAVKIIENHAGRAFMNQVQVMVTSGPQKPPEQKPPAQPPAPPPAPLTPSQPKPAPHRPRAKRSSKKDAKR